MCGIVGLVGAGVGSGDIGRMNALLTHRGPDDSGEYQDPEAQVFLAMRRLSILDVEGGHQPMSNADGTLWIVHNGEIYNAPELRAGLTAQGALFRSSHSDTEVLLQLYERRGAEMLADLNGMFAFVLYDKKRRRLFGARDRFGIKPLYLMEQPGGLAFASELKALLTLPGVRREINPESLFHYMSLLYVPGENSILQGIKRLPPAHQFTYDLTTRELTTESYWDLDVRRPQQRTEQEWVERIQSGLHDAVQRWTLSDVPVGCSLSGGIDSSAIVGMLAQMGHKVKTYSLGFTGDQEQAWNELPLARQVAQRWGTDHHELVMEPTDLLNDLVKMVWALDEPYGGGLPSWRVFQFMRKEVTVGLTGTGGDEVFGNYGKFLTYEGDPLGRIERFFQKTFRGNGHPSMRNYFNRWYHFSDAVKREQVFAASKSADSPRTAALLDALYETSQAENVRDGIAYVDFKTQLADEFLFMTDRFSMAHSLEARVPFLDHPFVEMVFQIPAEIRTRGNDPKYLLKKAVSHLLPPDLLTARKRGFVIPVRLWLRRELRPLAESLLSRERLGRQGILQPEFYDRFVQPHLTGQADHTWQVWAALMFQLWHLVFIEERCTQTPTFTWQSITQ